MISIIDGRLSSYNILQSFEDVPISDEGVDTETFLEASDGLVQMFGENLVLV
jgi:hypothetical protein